MIIKTILILAFVGVFMTNVAYGQYLYGLDLPKELPQVTLQLVLRDSDGHLVAYVIADQIVAIDPTVLDRYLDNKQNRKITDIDGKSYEIIWWQGKTEKIEKTHAMTTFVLHAPVGQTYQTALEILHDSYQVSPGDTVTVYWSVSRPI